MAFLTGQRLTADALNQNTPLIIAETVISASSSAIGTTETSAFTVTGTLVSGLVYKVVFSGRIGGNTAGILGLTRIREDTVSGTIQGFTQTYIGTTTGNGFACEFEANYTAIATGSKTFAFTLQSSSGTVTAIATAQGPSFLRIQNWPS